MPNSLLPHELKHGRFPCPLLSPGVFTNSCPFCRWCHPTILPYITPFSSSPQCFPAPGSFQMSQLFAWGSQSIGASVSASVLQMNIQDWFPLGLSDFICLPSKWHSSLLQHHSSKASILRFSAFFMIRLSHSYMTTERIIALIIWTFVSKGMSLLFNALYRLVIDFLPRSKCLLILWLQSSSTVILEPKKIKIYHCFYFFPNYLPQSDGTRCHDLLLNVEL